MYCTCCLNTQLIRQDFLIGTSHVLTNVLLIQWIQVLFWYGSLSRVCINKTLCWTKTWKYNYLWPTCPSEYLFVKHEPSACSTALLAKFSLAIISKQRFCRSFSLWIRSSMSGSMTDMFSCWRKFPESPFNADMLAGKYKTWTQC